MAITDEIIGLLKGGPLEALASAVGLGADGAEAGATDGVKGILAGLVHRLEGDGGQDAVHALVRDSDPSILDDIGGFLSKGDFSKGLGALGAIFGGRSDAVSEGLGSHLGLGKGMGGKLLSMLAPIVLGFLSKRGLNAAGLAGLLRGLLPSLLGGSGGKLLGALGLAGLGTGAAKATAAVADEPRRKRGGIWPLLGALVLGLGLLVFGLNECGKDDTVSTTTTAQTDTTSSAGANLIASATDAGSYSTLLGLVDDAGLTDTLNGPGPYTLLGPNDDAFAGVPAEALTALKADPAALKKALLGHVLDGRFATADLADGQQLTTLAGTTIKVGKTEDGQVTLDGVAIDNPDVDTSNGLLQGLSGVLGRGVFQSLGLKNGIAGDYGPWRVRAYREKVWNKILKPATRERSERLENYKGGFGIRINPA